MERETDANRGGHVKFFPEIKENKDNYNYIFNIKCILQ